MTLREYSAVISTIFMVLGTAWYIRQIIVGDVKPLLAAWIVLTGTLSLSLITYWTTKDRDLVSNITNVSAALSALSVFAVLVYTNAKRGIRIAFTPFQKFSLSAALVIAILWVALVWGFGKSGLIPNVLTQILMVVGYLVMVQRFWNATEVTDSYVLWGGIALSSLFGLYTAVVSKDSLAILFAARGIITAGGIVLLMLRTEIRVRKARLAVA